MSTFSKIRVGKKGSSAGVPKLIAKITFDPSVPVAATGYVLPAGSIVLAATAIGSATGGTAPTMDVGLAGTTDGFVNEADADAGTAVVGTGSLLFGTALTADTEVWAGEGVETSATGGTAVVFLEYIIEDTTNGVNQ
jgi:hypothetical protein